jgi:hypothetical protein
VTPAGASAPTRAGTALVVAAVLAWALLAAWLARRLAGLALDDFFITYRYAWNLAAGHGFAFNPGERVFGTTEPGLALLLAGLTFATRLPIPALGTWLTAAGLVASAALLLAAARRRGRLPEALAGGTLALASSFLWVSHGAAAPLVLACLLLAAGLDPERPRGEILAGLLAGAAVWLRPDAVVGAGLLGLLFCWEWRERRRLPWRYGLAAGAVIAAGLLAALAAFGSALPQTGVAKHAMAAAAAGREAGAGFWPAAFPLLARHWGPRWTWVAALGIAGLPALAAGAGRAGRLLALYAAALAILYPFLGVPFFVWYAFPVAFAALYGTAFVAGWAGRALATRLAGRWTAAGRAAIAAVAALAILLPAALSLLPASAGWFRAYRWFPYLATYRRAALFVHRRSAPADAVAYVEIGVIGYYGRQPLVDLLGLVTPGSIPYVEKGDLVGAFLARPTTWVLFHTRGRMRPLVTRPWFLRAYEAAARFADSDGRGAMTVFRRRPGAPLPPAGPPGAAHDLNSPAKRIDSRLPGPPGR